jgi:hypothetical protein
MANLCSAQVTSNANSKLCRLSMVIDDTTRSAPERMELVMRIAAEYDRGTAGSVERFKHSDVTEFRERR